MNTPVSKRVEFIKIYELKYSTRSPFLTLLSRFAHSGRWSSYREKGVVHRITYSINYLFFKCFLFTQIIVDKMKKKGEL